MNSNKIFTTEAQRHRENGSNAFLHAAVSLWLTADDAREDVLNRKKILTTEAQRHGENRPNAFLRAAVSLWLKGLQA